MKAVQQHLLAEHARVAAESPLPVGIAEHHQRSFSRRFSFAGQE
jgi:hypothetical protein